MCLLLWAWQTVNKCLAALLPLLSCPEGKAKVTHSFPNKTTFLGPLQSIAT